MIESFPDLFAEDTSPRATYESDDLAAIKVSWKIKHVQFTEEDLEVNIKSIGCDRCAY